MLLVNRAWLALLGKGIIRAIDIIFTVYMSINRMHVCVPKLSSKYYQIIFAQLFARVLLTNQTIGTDIKSVSI